VSEDKAGVRVGGGATYGEATRRESECRKTRGLEVKRGNGRSSVRRALLSHHQRWEKELCKTPFDASRESEQPHREREQSLGGHAGLWHALQAPGGGLLYSHFRPSSTRILGSACPTTIAG
jgi:hypothetical protein